MADRWNLKPPTLIISIIGSRAELSKRFKLTLKNGLWKAAESAGCCIISDGLDRGMTKVAGEAVRDYMEAYGGDHMVMVGVTGSDQIAFHELFKPDGGGLQHSKGRDPRTTVYYPEPLSDEEPDENAVSSTSSMDLPYWSERLLNDMQSKPAPPADAQRTGVPFGQSKPSAASAQLSESQRDWTTGGKRRKFRLNDNHQYLLLVNNDRAESKEIRYNRYLETRILFERTIVTWAKPSIDAPAILGTKKPRASVALPSLVDGLFDGGDPVAPRIHSKQSIIPGDTDPSVPNRSLGRDGESLVPRNLSSVAGAMITPERMDTRGSHASMTETQTTPSEVIAKVPICGIVAGSGSSLIEHVYASVTLNRCPMVIVRGTGGMADVIANVMDFMAFKNSFEENVITDEEIDMKIASIIHETRTEAQGQPQGGRARGKKFQSRTKEARLGEKRDGADGARTTEGQQAAKPKAVNLKAYSRLVELLRDLTENYGHLLSVFDSEDTDLDGYMISALLSSAGLDTPRNELNLDQLEIAIRLNRADIARTKIFLEGKHWKRGGLDDFMFTVILNDQNDFVSLLLENGFNLEEFLTVHTLERLYTEFLKKTDYKTGLFQQLWKRARIYKMEWVMLRDIGRIIKNLVGDFYHPLYLSKKFRNTVVERGAHDSSDEDDMDLDSSQFKGQWRTDYGRERSNGLIEPGNSSSATTSASSLPEEETVYPNSGRPRARSTEPTGSRSTLSAESLKPQAKPKSPGSQSKRDLRKSRPVEFDDSVRGSTTVTGRVPAELTNGRSVSNVSRITDDGDQVTLKGTSDSASDAGSDTTLIHHSRKPRRQTSRPQSRPVSIEPQPNGRRCIVRPITGLNLGYQPYLGFTNPVYNGDVGSGRNHSEGRPGRAQTIGRRRLVTITQDGQTVIMAPKAQAESTRNLSIVSSNQANGTVSRTPSSHDLSHSVRSEVSKRPREQGRESNVRHAVFADDLNQPLFRRARSASYFTLGRTGRSDLRPNIPGARRKSSSGARRVAHSILHPLTDPEKAQLQIREIERMARERRREKERRHRHRVAQGKFTLMERLTGKAKEQRLEELKPAKLANFSHTSTVTFERPAREIMVMCILVGKLTMAEVFWSYEKEPIASALVASILFSELASKSDDVANKEEYEEAARRHFEPVHKVQMEWNMNISVEFGNIDSAYDALCPAKCNFEEKAEEVLEECHQEDRVRTQLLLCRKLEFYGGSSAIRLAARGRCIRFMAHPCCQELLSGVWMGELSPKYTWFQPPADYDSVGTQYGLCFIRYYEDEKRWKIQLMRIKAFYRAPVIRFIYNTIFYLFFLLLFSWTLLTGLTLSFNYFELFLVLMVVSFLSEELKQALGPGSSLREYISDGWNQLDCLAIGFFIIGLALKFQVYSKIKNEARAAYLHLLRNRTESLLFIDDNNTTTTNNTMITLTLENWWTSNRTWFDGLYAPNTTRVTNGTESPLDNTLLFVNRAWNFSENLLPQVADLILDGAPRGATGSSTSGLAWNLDDPYFLLNNQTVIISRIFYALSLFAFYVRLMYIFSFSMVLGPKLIMLNRMIVHDLLPFLLILVVCQMGYGIAVHSIAYANGYFADYEQFAMTINSTIKWKTGLKSIYDAIITSYFQMFGLFSLNELQGESSECRDDNMCPQTSARRLSVVMLSAFVLLTQVLMFNLLVATFTSTYNEIEGSSSYFWCYQRYEMIQEFVDRPSVAPPFMLVSYTIEFTGFLCRKLCNVILGRESEQDCDDDPFCKSRFGVL
ncbi:unnamed protein product [Echinostoma caproni]|uniref:Ion_trans domain-containing protein n=1 Tax=Echinostoma caproni TaxID=27848 RepID=A0A3P8FKH0_9TREM|nr:unnamed protein product [Echinostoma caproni]